VSGPATFALPARLDLPSAGPLAQELRAHFGGDLTLDAGAVSHLGTPGLQVLLAACTSWAASGHVLTIENAPPGLAEQLAQFGLGPEDLVTGSGGAAAGPSPAAAEAAPDAAGEAETADGDTTEEDQP